MNVALALEVPAMKPIVTLTLNPAIDASCEAEEVRPIHKIRTFDERFHPGGGGLNVARVVREPAPGGACSTSSLRPRAKTGARGRSTGSRCRSIPTILAWEKASSAGSCSRPAPVRRIGGDRELPHPRARARLRHGPPHRDRVRVHYPSQLRGRPRGGPGPQVRARGAAGRVAARRARHQPPDLDGTARKTGSRVRDSGVMRGSGAPAPHRTGDVVAGRWAQWPDAGSRFPGRRRGRRATSR